jgi:protein-S-isoprenylcysteine O-methyltransferase Ste14
MKRNTTEVIGYVINAVSIALFLFLAGVLDVPRLPSAIEYLGWLFLGLGLVLVVLSTVTLMVNREGRLIERGVYGMVRHPMYVGAMLMFLSWIFFVPHWIIILMGCVNVAIVYWFILQGDRRNMAKFGDAYGRYIKAVPRMNLLAGLVNLLRRT